VAGEFFFAALASVGAPKKDAREDLSLLAEVRGKALGVNRIVLAGDAVRSYFYQAEGSQSFYGLLGVESHVSDAELRMAYKIRILELKRENAERATHAAVERAFNILGHPDLRAGYDSWMRDPETPLAFPYGSLGSILVAGNRPPDGQTFFAHEILTFLPEVQRRRFRAPLRRCEFYESRALYRDASRRVEVWLDPAMFHMSWTPEWNQWKRHLASKIEIQGSFVTRARYRKKAGAWNKSLWETALPSEPAYAFLQIWENKLIELANNISDSANTPQPLKRSGPFCSGNRWSGQTSNARAITMVFLAISMSPRSPGRPTTILRSTSNSRIGAGACTSFDLSISSRCKRPWWLRIRPTNIEAVSN